jgi:hypothetical protein
LQVWYGAVLRGDKNKIKIGRQTNVQDRAVIGTVSNLDSGFPSNVDIGDQVGCAQKAAASMFRPIRPAYMAVPIQPRERVIVGKMVVLTGVVVS